MRNKMLVTGNGFDLYHGLPTRYTDFLAFSEYWSVFEIAYDETRDLYSGSFAWKIR